MAKEEIVAARKVAHKSFFNVVSVKNLGLKYREDLAGLADKKGCRWLRQPPKFEGALLRHDHFADFDQGTGYGNGVGTLREHQLLLFRCQ